MVSQLPVPTVAIQTEWTYTPSENGYIYHHYDEFRLIIAFNQDLSMQNNQFAKQSIKLSLKKLKAKAAMLSQFL